VSDERRLFVEHAIRDGERDRRLRMRLAPAAHEHVERSGQPHLLERYRPQPRENASVDALQCGDLLVELFAIMGDARALSLSPQSADASANREEKWSHLVVQVPGDVAALGFL